MSALIFFDGNETPTYVLDQNPEWRPPKRDVSWRVETEGGRVIEEYHPAKRDPIMPLTLKVRLRTVYGREAIYPANQAAEAIAAIAGTSQLPASVLRIAKKQLGAVVMLDDSANSEKLAELLKD